MAAFCMTAAPSPAQTVSSSALDDLATEIGAVWEASRGRIVKRGNKPPATAAAMERVLAHPEVTALLFDGTKLEPEILDIIAMKGSNLRSLWISHFDVGHPDFLAPIARMPQLTDLMLGSSTFGDEGLGILSALRNTQSLRLTHVSQDPAKPITAKGLRALATGMPDLGRLEVNLHRMEDDMIPALVAMKKLTTLSVEWVSPGFIARLRAAMPGVKIVARANKYVRDGFDPANRDPATDFINEDGSPRTPPAAPAPKASEGAAADLPPIEAQRLLDAFLDDPKTRESLITGARGAVENLPARSSARPIRILVLSTAPVGPQLSMRNVPGQNARQKIEGLSEEEISALSQSRTAGVRAKNLHGLGAAALIVLLREMASQSAFLSLTEVTGERTVTREMIDTHDVVLLNNVGQTDRPELFNEWLPDFVRRGGGLVANHGTCYLFVDQPDAEFNRLLGGRLNFPAWVAHPERGGGKFLFRLPHPEHPSIAALRGHEDQPLADELYNLIPDSRLPEPPRVLMEIDPEGMTQVFPEGAGDFSRALVWTREEGKGRVWYMQFGHFPRALHHPLIAGLLLDGLLYAAGPPGDAVHVPPIFPFWQKRFEGDDAWLTERGYSPRPFIKPAIDLTAEDPFADGKLDKWIRSHRDRGIVMLHFKEPATEADEDRALPALRRLAGLAERQGLQMVVYPYFGSHIDTAERALPFVKKLNCPKVGLTLHLPQEIKNGNAGRLPEIIATVKDEIRLVVVCGADAPRPGDNPADWEWGRMIRPIGEGDYDLGGFVQAVRASGYRGPYAYICWQFTEPPQTHLARSMDVWRGYFID